MLQEYLRANKKTQREFAEELGITQVHMSRICTGARMPSMRLALRIHNVTGGQVSMDSWNAQ